MWTDCLFTEQFHSAYITVLQAVATTLISISVAVFTLSSSFLVSKVEGIDKIVSAIENGGISISTQKRIRDVHGFVEKMKSVTINALIALPLAIIGFIAYVTFSFWRIPCWELTAIIPLIVSMVYISISLTKLIKWYYKFHKHH